MSQLKNRLRLPTIKSGSFKFNRFKICFRIVGENLQGTPLLCINGAQQYMGSWMPLLNSVSLSQPTLLFDFPEQGKSKVLSGSEKLSLEEQEQIIKSLLLHLKVSTVNIIANSWGGIIATSFASNNVSQVKKLLLVSYTTKPNMHLIETIDEGLKKYDNKNFKEISKIIINGFGENLPEKFKSSLEKQFKNINAQQLELFKNHCYLVRETKDFSDNIQYEKIKAKTLLAIGELDPIIELNSTVDAALKIKDCEILVAKSVGHFMHFENLNLIDYYHQFFQNNEFKIINKRECRYYTKEDINHKKMILTNEQHH